MLKMPPDFTYIYGKIIEPRNQFYFIQYDLRIKESTKKVPAKPAKFLQRNKRLDR